jgi:hypothetical protein
MSNNKTTEIEHAVKSLTHKLLDLKCGVRVLPSDEHAGVKYVDIGYAVISKQVSTRLNCIMSDGQAVFTHKDNCPSAIFF